MYQPRFHRPGPWYHCNIRVAGLAIAGQCVLGIVIFGFGLLLMGTISMAASTAFDTDSKPDPAFDTEFFRKHASPRPTTNVPRVIGAVFLSIGGVLFVVGVVLLIITIRKFKSEVQQPANQMGNVTVSTVNYPASQRYQQGQTQPYQQGQTQPYQTGPEQPYPGPTYPNSGAPLISGSGQTQPYPTGLSGQPSYNPSYTAGQPPVGPGQPYPNAPVGQPQQYHEKTENVPSNPYNSEQSCPYPTGFAQVGQPPHSDVPPPYYGEKI